ncbi:hypothetical protein [Peterkaempfera sp. SMS 1(5)a]|uniref:hypothetical protein n=1 Tax=Peterkaempfera podocarpi TaxID=3232308 RepID=UPI00366ABF78
MSGTAASRREFGEGPLARAAAVVYSLMTIELLLLATTAPCLLLLALLDRDASNVPLAAACALPVGPAWSAALYAWHHRSSDITDLRPAPAFRRGYRTNLTDTLKIWVPWLVGATLVGTTLTHLGAAGIPRWWAALLGLMAVVSALWVANALVITSLFSFRPADTARLAAYFLVRSVRATLGNLGLLAAAAAVTVAYSEAVPLLLASVLAAATLLNCRPMITEIREEFTV